MSMVGEEIWQVPHGRPRIFGGPWSPQGHRIRDLLARSLVSFEWSGLVRPERRVPGLGSIKGVAASAGE